MTFDLGFIRKREIGGGKFKKEQLVEVSIRDLLTTEAKCLLLSCTKNKFFDSRLSIVKGVAKE